MEIFDNPPTIPSIRTPEPTVAELQEKIQELTRFIDNKNDLLANSYKTASTARDALHSFKERVKNVLIEALEDYDQDTVKHIAEQLDIPLTVTKQIEVNVTFTIDLEHEIGEEPDPEWDFDFSLSHDSVVDYSTDVIYHRDA